MALGARFGAGLPFRRLRDEALREFVQRRDAALNGSPDDFDNDDGDYDDDDGSHTGEQEGGAASGQGDPAFEDEYQQRSAGVCLSVAACICVYALSLKSLWHVLFVAGC
jgi:hypothetical protein